MMTKFSLCSEEENVSDSADLGHSAIPCAEGAALLSRHCSLSTA